MPAQMHISTNIGTALKLSVFGVILVRIRRDTEYISVFSQNPGKYGPNNSSTDTFYAVKDITVIIL